jgi:hypothetical protein
MIPALAAAVKNTSIAAERNLALAALLDCELSTTGKRLINCLQGHNKRVHWVGKNMFSISWGQR